MCGCVSYTHRAMLQPKFVGNKVEWTFKKNLQAQESVQTQLLQVVARLETGKEETTSPKNKDHSLC